MKVAVSGASGFVGSKLVRTLDKKGYEVIIISRNDLLKATDDLAKKINGVYAIVNLSGASILKRWTRKHKREIYTSRVGSTRKIVEAIKICEFRPEILVSASAIGIYDNIHIHHEESRFLACDYLSKVIRDWEHASNIAMEYGVATSILRLGIVLGKGGGMIKKVLPLFKKGLGGMIGKGNQKFSYIHIDDLQNIILSIIKKSLNSGVYNVVAPEENTNKSFTHCLSDVLGKRNSLHVPAWVIRVLYGDGAEVLLSGQQVIPGKLQETGFQFKYPDLESTLKEITGK